MILDLERYYIMEFGVTLTKVGNVLYDYANREMYKLTLLDEFQWMYAPREVLRPDERSEVCVPKTIVALAKGITIVEGDEK